MRYERRHIAIGAIVSFMLAIPCIPTALSAESPDSLCVHFIGDSHIRLKGSYSLSGEMPVILCEMQRGERYRMIVDGEGIESRIGTFKVASDGRISSGGIRFGAAMRNAILPGLGSCFSGRRMVGWIDGLSLSASLYVLYQEDREFRDLEDRYNDLTRKLSEAELLETKQELERAAHEAALEANVQNKHRKRLALFSAILYGMQVLDPFVLSPPPRTSIEARGNMVRIEAPRISVPKAFFFSLVHPGRGQFYQGKNARGLLFSALTVASGLTALEYHNRYDREANRYEILVERFEMAATVEEKEDILSEASRQWDEVEEARTLRNTTYIITTGLWAWNVIDTFWRNEGGTNVSRYSFEWSPLSGAVVLRF
jgi:hypothetical protein